MSNPIKEALAYVANTVAEGLVKIGTPCEEQCMEKCERTWRKTKEGFLCNAPSDKMDTCIRRCRNFQYRSPPL